MEEYNRNKFQYLQCGQSTPNTQPQTWKLLGMLAKQAVFFNLSIKTIPFNSQHTLGIKVLLAQCYLLQDLFAEINLNLYSNRSINSRKNWNHYGWKLPFSSCGHARFENPCSSVLPKHLLENLSHNFHGSAIIHFNTANLHSLIYIPWICITSEYAVLYATHCSKSYSPHFKQKPKVSLSHKHVTYL